MLTQEGIVEIDAKGVKTKASVLVREFALFNTRLRASSLIIAGVTKGLLADCPSELILYPKQKALRQEALENFTNVM